MASARFWIRNADIVVTMDAERGEPAGSDILVKDGRIESVGAGGPGDPAAWQAIDAAGCVVTPALVNTHHHLFQTLTRAVPACQDALLFGWLKSLYPVWARMRPEDMFVSAQLGLAELALSGCGTSADHLYLYPEGVRLEDTIEAAATIGLRFHATRGAMSVGESGGGLPPDSLVERERDIIEDCIRVVDAFDDTSEGAMVRIAIAPLLPVLRLPRADARCRRAGGGQGGRAAHPPGGERRGRRLLAGNFRMPARRLCRVAGLAGRSRVARPLRGAR